MLKILTILSAVALGACGSASSASPKTSNPPLTSDQRVKKTPNPAAKPPVEQDGLTVKFNDFGFKMTMTPSPWKGDIVGEANDKKILFRRPDIEGGLIIARLELADMNAKAIVEYQHQLASKAPDLTVTPVVAEPNGRYAFTGDLIVEGKTWRIYIAVLPHPSTPDVYLMAIVQVSIAQADAFLAEVRTILDTVAPL